MAHKLGCMVCIWFHTCASQAVAELLGSLLFKDSLVGDLPVGPLLDKTHS